MDSEQDSTIEIAKKTLCNFSFFILKKRNIKNSIIKKDIQNAYSEQDSTIKIAGKNILNAYFRLLYFICFFMLKKMLKLQYIYQPVSFKTCAFLMFTQMSILYPGI